MPTFDEQMQADTPKLLSTFGTPGLLTTPGEPDITITVTFSEKPIDIMGVQSDKPMIAADAIYRERMVNRDSALIIDGTEYRMIKPQTETGLTTAYLARI